MPAKKIPTAAIVKSLVNLPLAGHLVPLLDNFSPGESKGLAKRNLVNFSRQQVMTCA